MEPPDHPPPIPPPIVEPDIAGQSRNLASEDVPCLNCGYNLRGLDEDGRCPECGVPIERSLRGNLLLYSGTDYLATLHRGVVLIMIGIIGTMVTVVGAIVIGVVVGLLSRTPVSATVAATTFEAMLTVVNGGVTLIALVGWWMFSAPDPAVIGHETGSRARVVVRSTVLVEAAVTVGIAVVEVTAINTVSPGSNSLVTSVGVAGVLAGVVKFFAAMLYIRWLAPRIPSPPIDQKAKQYLWLIPLLVLLTLCTIYISTLVAFVLYILLLNTIRLDLRALRSQQAEMYPTT